MRAGCQPTKLEPHTEMWGKLDEIVRFYLFILQLSICQEQPLTKQQWNSNSSNHYTAASIISTFRVAGAVPRASQKGLRRALSPLVPLAVFLMAGAVPRASRRGCGARCRRWCRWLSSAWQAQYPEPPEGAAARVVAAGAAGCPRGRRSTQSLQKGLRRALSPLVPLAVFLVAGAVPRASRRGCGARCRRWCRWLSSWQAQYPEPPELRGCGARCRRWCRWLSSSWQAQYPEPPEGAAARVVAAGAAGCLRGRRSTQSLQKGLRRALSPLVPLAVFLVAGAVPRASRRGCGARCRRWCRWLSSSWQAQYPEPPEGAAARVVAAGAAGCLPAWQAQSREPPEGAVARVVAAGAAFCLPRGRRSRESLQKGLWRALSPLVPLLPRALVRALSPEFFPVAGCRRS